MKTKFLAAALLSSANVPLAFANSNAGSILYISTTSTPNVMALADYQGLSWLQVSSLGDLGETGSKTNILSYNTWDTSVIQKAKGLTDAGSPTVEVARVPTDAGQIAMRAAALTNVNYSFKVVHNDPAVPGGVGSIMYNRGLVTGPTRPGGKNEDFDLEVFTLAYQQLEIVSNPGAGGNPPVPTVAPAITPSPPVHATVTTCSTGTFTGDATITYTYQWFENGNAISGATAATYTPGLAEVGKFLQCRVTATNASGSASVFSPMTSAIT